MRYRRSDVAGGTYLFTVNLADRSSDMLVRHVDQLREVMNKVKETHPFSMVAMVVLPEHLHAIWRLPPGDADYPGRWSLIKTGFSRRVERGERIRESRAAKSASAASGNGGIGNTRFGMKLTWHDTLTTYTLIR